MTKVLQLGAAIVVPQESVFMMVSIWWAVGMFVLGAYAGMLVFALMSVARRESEHCLRSERAVERDGLGSVNLEEDWTT